MADAAVEELVQSLLWEGYALYPYTPGSAKNATPTPFGIVYPPVYAAQCPGAFDHARLECLARAGPGALLSAQLRWLEPSGDRHEALERAATIAAVAVGERATVMLDGGRFTLRSQLRDDGLALVRCCLHNTRVAPAGLDRAGALARALISTQILVSITDGAFISPLESDCASVNTYPVLVGEADRAVLGTGIVLPDHPQIAPESRGGLFDSTEIEEALLLHVKTLSDGELAEIERQDPAVREMIARAAAATPEEIVALHGRVTISDRVSDRVTMSPPAPPPDLPDPQAGEPEACVDGVRFVRGGKVVIRPPADADLHARMLDGRRASIERIFTDYDGRVHLGLTIDSDPGQQLLRETGRYLFFFAEEVEVI
ncbi:MAG: hypothetical protein ACRDMX_04135 [Solirubrobacteraceae bacterium]